MHSSVTPPILSRRTLRHIDWALILLNLILAAINGSFTLSETFALQIFAFNGLFFLLSFIQPVEHSLWERRVYIGLALLVIAIAAAKAISFDLMLYWTIAKSCFWLSRSEAILIAIVGGSGYLLGHYWSYPYTVSLMKTTGIEQWLNPQRMFLNRLSFYLGASSLTLLFSLLAMIEQRSRRKAEALTQQVKTLAVTLERTRIAREIHDSLGHSLTALDIQLELAQRLYPKDPTQAEQSLQAAQQLTAQCLTEVRRSVQTMRGNDFNLNEAIANLVNAIRQNQSLTIRLDIQLPPLPMQVGHQLYCIIQEGLTNIQKHSGAEIVTLTGKYDANTITIMLQDDGQGFRPQVQPTGFGLRGMQERTQILGGQFTIHSTPGDGTWIQVVIPYLVAS